MKPCSGLRNSKNIKSQIAIIVTFVIAVIILMVIVFVNIAKVSGVKTLTAKVADKSALSLASRIGSMAHYFKEEILGGKTEDCSVDWIALGLFIAGIIAAFVFFPVAILFSTLLVAGLIGGLGVGLMAGGLVKGFVSSRGIHDAVYEQFQKMSVYNATREQVLFGALASLQTDDTLLRPGGEGIFYEDLDGDEEKDPGEPEYDLSGIEEMRNAKAAGRFFAWYYKKRLPLVSEEGLEDKINDFLDYLKLYIDIDEWDANKWMITKASFTVEPGGGGDIDVTCSSCPDWVADADNNRIRVVTIDDNKKEWPDIVFNDYKPFGFLPEKFNSLCEDLEGIGGVYDLSFCEDPWYWWPSCEGIGDVVLDLKRFLVRTKEVLNLPISIRIQSVAEWFTLFYDVKYDRSQSEADDYKHDIYDRLTRDEIEINKWITELTNLNNNTIRPDIQAAHGYCGYGVGDAVSECPLVDCCDWDDSGNCICACFCCCPGDCDTCTWEGTYCSCTDGDGKPPACRHGDLYEEPPDWCDLTDDTPGCMCSCEPSPSYDTDVDACDFQGYYGKKERGDPEPTGPTEVAQAIEILKALNKDIYELRLIIGIFSNILESILIPDDSLRNEVVYAWEGKDERNHLVRVKIENYPKDMPYISEEREWGGLQICRELHAYSGDFTITASRYDEDMPTPWWKSRYRRQPTADEFDKAKLQAIVMDIQDNGEIDTTQADVDNLLNDYAIFSKTKGYYGPDKPDIRIERQK